MPSRIIDLQPDVAIAGISKLAVEFDALSQLSKASQQGLGQVLEAFNRDMTDMILAAYPAQAVIDSLNAALPKIDLTENLAISQAAKNASRTLVEALATSFDTSSFASLAGAVLSQPGLDELTKITNIMTSDVFEAYKEALRTDFHIDISDFLGGVLLEDASVLRSIVGDSEEVIATTEILSGKRPIDDLAPDFKARLSEMRECIYNQGIAAIVLVWYVLSCLHLLQNGSVESASELVQAVLMLLLVLKDMANNEKSEG